MGLRPRPFAATTAPPMMKPVDDTARTTPQISTGNSSSPYGSMRAMYTPPMRLLNVEKMMRANSPGTARIAATAPRTSTNAAFSVRSGSFSGMRSASRCASATTVNPIAIASVHPMPRRPTEKPESTLVTRNARPPTVPTSPLAFACRSVGTSRVTVVDSAMLRRFSTTAPARMMPLNSQNHGAPRSSSSASECDRYRPPAAANATSEKSAETTITRCLRCRSTSVPNTMPKTASSSM